MFAEADSGGPHPRNPGHRPWLMKSPDWKSLKPPRPCPHGHFDHLCSRDCVWCWGCSDWHRDNGGRLVGCDHVCHYNSEPGCDNCTAPGPHRRPYWEPPTAHDGVNCFGFLPDPSDPFDVRCLNSEHVDNPELACGVWCSWEDDPEDAYPEASFRAQRCTNPRHRKDGVE